MPGLSSSASAGSVGGASGRAALARVGRAGSFLECLAGSRVGLPLGAFGGSGAFAIAEIWRLAYDGKRAEQGSAPEFVMRGSTRACALSTGEAGTGRTRCATHMR